MPMIERSLPLAEQAGCIPFRFEGPRRFVALITSRSGRRWVIPKGLVEPGEAPWQTALREAFEEAELVGRIGFDAIGSYAYRKNGRRRRVAMHLLHVDDHAERWPESTVRARHWMTPAEAAACVREPSLARLLLSGVPSPSARGD